MKRLFLWLLGFAVLPAVAMTVGLNSPDEGRLGAGSAQGATTPARVVAVVVGRGAELYDLPGGTILRFLSPGAAVTLTGRSFEGNWVVAQTGTGEIGWMETASLVQFGVNRLPVLDERTEPDRAMPAAPAMVPMVTPTLTPSPTPAPSLTTTPTHAPTAVPAARHLSGAAAAQVGVARTSILALYATPGGDPLATLGAGAVVQVLGRSPAGDWLLVHTDAGLEGWVASGDLVFYNAKRLQVVAVGAGGNGAPSLMQPTGTVGEPSPTATTPVTTTASEITATVLLTDSRLNLRAGPSIGYALLGKAQPGEQLTALGRNADGTWVHIATLGAPPVTGWVAAEFVALSAPLAALPLSLAPSPTPTAAAMAPEDKPARQTRALSELPGKLIIQTGGDGGIFLYAFATGELRRLTAGSDPALSPDGRKLAFVRGGGDSGLYLLDLERGVEGPIFRGGEGLRTPAWSPDGSQIAFARKIGNFQCRQVEFAGCLPDTPFLDDFDLVIQEERGLSVVDRSGADFRDLPALTSVAAPAWGPEGIVYHASTSLEITGDGPGETTRALVQDPYLQDPTWQPNADRVVFQRREGDHWELFAVHGDGTGLVALTRPVTTLVDQLPSNVAPTFSPDGQWLAYLSNRDGQNRAGPWRIWVMTPDGGAPRPLPLDLPIDYSYAGEPVIAWGP